jgi:hypothetical protein
MLFHFIAVEETVLTLLSLRLQVRTINASLHHRRPAPQRPGQIKSQQTQSRTQNGPKI